MNKEILRESNAGIIYRINKVPASMFNFYILKKQDFKDHTHKYAIGVELAANPGKKYFVIETIRGHKSDAIKRLETIIRNS